ncbi:MULTISPECIES: hypothetical protein [Spirulina sp. CCY15215]|uniref:hypothetical protein n=1 Tax=Spirulina sp. CCY15215 TaxID=2767591 RepID=UPI0019521184|nr:hypothetical protein [Spirulina major]
MSSDFGETDEDKQIARLKVHRDLVGWIINKLEEAGIQAQRTTGGDPKGDVEVCDRNDIPRVREILFQIQGKAIAVSNSETQNSFLEVKAYTRKKIDSTLARKLINKETIMGLIATGKITKPAKKLLDDSEIIWIEEFPESNLSSD